LIFLVLAGVIVGVLAGILLFLRFTSDPEDRLWPVEPDEDDRVG
jgi:hypothetical protein